MTGSLAFRLKHNYGRESARCNLSSEKFRSITDWEAFSRSYPVLSSMCNYSFWDIFLSLKFFAGESETKSWFRNGLPGGSDASSQPEYN